MILEDENTETVYNVKIDLLGKKWIIHKKYKDLLSLQERLKSKFDGIPELKSKEEGIFNSKKDELTLKKDFESYLKVDIILNPRNFSLRTWKYSVILSSQSSSRS